jgi:hypothetical protein
MIYEMRIYRCLPGRLPALLKRFDTITLKLWEKHGIKQAGFFTTLIGMDHRSRQDRGRRPDRRQYREPAPGAHAILRREVNGRATLIFRPKIGLILPARPLWSRRKG